MIPVSSRGTKLVNMFSSSLITLSDLNNWHTRVRVRLAQFRVRGGHRNFSV